MWLGNSLWGESNLVEREVDWIEHESHGVSGHTSCKFRERCPAWIYTGKEDRSKQNSPKSMWRGVRRTLNMWTVQQGGSRSRKEQAHPISSHLFLLPTILCSYCLRWWKQSHRKWICLGLSAEQQSLQLFCAHVFQACNLSGCSLERAPLYPHYTFIVTTKKICPGLRFSEQREMDENKSSLHFIA